MNKPAARQTDATVHGGCIVAGAPTVFIENLPAARVTDHHTCPMCNPGGSPHVGGPIALGSANVLICGQQAARVGDMCVCQGPLDRIAQGSGTVLIGEQTDAEPWGVNRAVTQAADSVGAGIVEAVGEAESRTAPADTGAVAQPPADDADEAEAEAEPTHYLDVAFADKAGYPICGVAYELMDPEQNAQRGVLAGRIYRRGIDPGTYRVRLRAITRAEWSPQQARDGETVKMIAETAGVEDGSPAILEVWERDYKRPDRKVAEFWDLQIQGSAVEKEWRYVWVDERPQVGERSRAYSAPTYYFVVKTAGLWARSGILDYKDFVELTLTDEDDRPVPGKEYRLYLSNGELREGILDANGYARIERVPPGAWYAEFPDVGYGRDNRP